MDSLSNPTIKEKLIEQIKLLEQSKNDDDFKETLENLKALLISSNHRDVQQMANELNLSELFHQFNIMSNEKFNDELLHVFGMFLELLPLDEIFFKYNLDILEGLQSKYVSIVELWIKKVVKPLFTNDGLVKKLSSNHQYVSNVKLILKSVIQLLPCSNISVAKAAHDICVSSARVFRQEFFSPEILDEFKSIKNHKHATNKDQDQFMIRYYELCVDIACINELLLDMMNANGFLAEMIEDFQQKLDKDPLVAVNIIKLTTDLASKPHGLEFLRNSTKSLPFIAKKIAEIDEETDFIGSLVLPSYINFFIKLSQSNLPILNEYPEIINKLIGYCQQGRSGNMELQLLAIESVAFLCHQSEGKVFLAEKMTIFLDTIIMMINSGKNELKSRAISALNEIMEIQGADPGSKANQLTETWYNYLDSQDCGLNRFMKFVLEPFLDIRIPALNFIHVLSTTLWGQKLLAAREDFLDYLLDRSTETCKEGREAKFEIVRELAMSPFIRLSFPPESQLKIRAYFKDGPVNAEVQVAFENS